MSLLQRIKILIVDDTTTSRMIVRDALETIGFRSIQVAADGEQALKMMMSSPSHFVISDMNMPKMNGLELLRAIRNYKPISRTPFIILTGSPDKSFLEEGKKLGLNNYLAKPFTPPQLRQAIEAITGKLS